LSKHEHIWTLFQQSGEVVNFFPETRKELVEAYKVFNPHYHVNLSCGACIAEMLKIIYNFYNEKVHTLRGNR
jgi:hypothetical protein